MTPREEAAWFLEQIAEWIEGDEGGMDDDDYRVLVVPPLAHLAADLGIEGRP